MKDIFRPLQGKIYDAFQLQAAVAEVRRTDRRLSAEYSVEQLMQYMDEAGWLRSVNANHTEVEVVIS